MSVLGLQHLRNTSSNDIFTLAGIAWASNTDARNLGVVFVRDVPFISHIKQTSRTACFHPCKIAKIRHILSQNDAEKLLHAFVLLLGLIMATPYYQAFPVNHFTVSS